MHISFFRGVAQWLRRLVWDQEIGGSNPPTPTMNKREVIDLLKPHTCNDCYYFGFVTFRNDVGRVPWCGGNEYDRNHPIPESNTCAKWSKEFELERQRNYSWSFTRRLLLRLQTLRN